MADFDVVRLKYDGGFATQGRIHLYEYSRAQYALSRFITIVGQYHQTGQVIERVTRDRTIDMIVSAPERGSFGLEILVPTVAPVVDALKSTSFEAIFAYVWAKLLPPGESRDQMAVKLAEIELAREQQRTLQLAAQQQGETERLQILRGIIEAQQAGTAQMIGLVDRALQAGDTRTLQAGLGPERLIEERKMLLADLQREQLLDQHQSELSRLDPKDLTRLTAKLRPTVAEIGLPLRRSADECSIGNAANDNSFIRLDRARLRQVGDRYIDEQQLFISGIVRSYDRYNGRGKIDSDDFSRQMPFLVELSERQVLRDKVLSAMRRGKLTCVCASYRDPAGQITSLILRDILLEG